MSEPAAKTRLSPRDFVHLHNHTHFSVLDGLQKLGPMIEHAKEMGMEAVAITDHGTMSGVIDFYKAANDAGIKPIIGMETYVARRKHTDKEGKQDANPYHLILLAMNNQGYENLMRLSSIACLDGFYYKPRIDHELLEKYNEGLIALSSCVGGEIGERLRDGRAEEAEEVALWYKKVFDDNRYFLELQDHAYTWDVQQEVNEKLIAIGKKHDIPCAMTTDAHYTKHEDQEAHEVLLCVQTGSLLSDEKRMSLKDTPLHMEDPAEIIKRWEDTLPEAITNTKAIADRCHVEIELGGILIPKFDVPDGLSERDYLHQLTYQGLAWRYAGLSKEEANKLSTEEAKAKLEKRVLDRAEYELGIIGDMGFDGYFLIVADFIIWGKAQGIVFGPGRGSAAGSIVAYGMTITDLDPLEHDLLFERFLNPDRISMPDIDIDIMDSRRDEVIQYTVDKYGQDHVAHIVTFGTMAARNAIRDVSRVLNVPYAEADRLAKLVPAPIQGRHIPLKTSIVEDPELSKEYEGNPQSKQVIDLAIRLEGTIRSHGIHAAGVVIAPDEIVKYTPLEMAQKGVVATQYSMNPVEELGLLKMDFLGLSNLTIIKNALRIIKKVYDQDIELEKLPMDDEKTYQLLARGETTGVFQLESSGMKRYLRELKPNEFSDIIAMCALYRPGPLGAGLTDSFVARKNGQEKVAFAHEKMKPALESTFGVLVYQEQVMQISKEVCGFTGGEADTLRKAIGKKKRDVMEKMQVKMIEGGVEYGGVPKPVMEKFWDDLMGFADYAFNKSHSACYALVAYETAYLKAHYPSAFMAALLTSDFEDTDRIAIEISECRHMGIEVLQPDVNESFQEFAVRPEDGAIRFGLAAIKNVGVGAVECIIEAREADGHFASIEDFARRISPREVNRKAYEALIKAGAFDSLGSDRSTLLHNLDTIVAYAQRCHKEANSDQIMLFGGADSAVQLPPLHLETPSSIVPDQEQLLWERELLGLYLSRHPLDDYDAFLKDHVSPMNSVTVEMEARPVTLGGIVGDVRAITTKTGSQMAFVKVQDRSDELELIVFPKAYEQYQPLLRQDAVVIVKGKVSTKDRDGKASGERKILVDEMREVTFDQVKDYEPGSGLDNDAFTGTSSGRLDISLPANADPRTLAKLKHLLGQHRGSADVYLTLQMDPPTTIKLPMQVGITPELQEQIKQLTEPVAV